MLEFSILRTNLRIAARDSSEVLIAIAVQMEILGWTMAIPDVGLTVDPVLLDIIANIKEMVERCVSCGTQKILLATNHVVTKQLEHESPSDRYSENAKSYNQVLRDSFSSSLMEIVTVVDMEILMAAKFRESNDYLLSDGVHLNRIGHSAYLDIVSSPIKEALNSIDVR